MTKRKRSFDDISYEQVNKLTESKLPVKFADLKSINEIIAEIGSREQTLSNNMQAPKWPQLDKKDFNDCDASGSTLLVRQFDLSKLTPKIKIHPD